MKFTLNWLNEFVEVTTTPQRLAELLTMAGLEVDSVTELEEPGTSRKDWLYELGVTPNRGDCLGLRGIAREVAALTGASSKIAPPHARPKAATAARRIQVAIEDSHLCSRYSAGIVDGIQVAPSPARLRFRLEACGIRAINNVVDITNYVMLETGQPLHAFDLDRLSARRIFTRAAAKPGKFVTLDGVERDITSADLLVCDGEVPVALAGVMGGIDSEVRASTQSILIESANFDATTIRRTAKRLGLHSEASHRFERGVDPEGTVAALERAADLFAELAGGKPVPGFVDRYPRRPRLLPIQVREERIAGLLGVAIDGARAAELLESIGIKTRRQAGKVIKAVPPPSRSDLTREADLIEELARLHGYENIPSTLPRLRPSGGTKDEHLAWERKVRAFLAGEGLVEVINLPFMGERLNRCFTGLWAGVTAPVIVANPLVKENGEMRLSLIPGLIENLRLNLAQKAASFWAYHLGKVFRAGQGGAPEERLCLAGILQGPRGRRGLRDGAEQAPVFLDCKGLLEGVLELLRIGGEISWSDEAFAFLHPGQSTVLSLGGEKLGYLGMIHPELGDAFGVPSFFVYELDLEKSLEYAPRKIKARSLPRFPSVGRDFALVVPSQFQSQQIVSWIRNLRQPLIEHVEVFDEYRGAPIPESKKSLAYKISYRAEDRTLTDAEINALHQNLVSEIGKVFGAEIRS